MPPEKMRTWDWVTQYAVTHKGDPFNGDLFPWCEGICDIWDKPDVERMFFRAGSRLGKTEISLAMHQAAQDMDPDVGMIGCPTEGLLMKTIGDRYFSMLEKSPKTRSYCPPVHRRNAKKVKCPRYIIYGGWSGSPTTLGDIDPRYVNLLEASKWTKNNSEEADPLELAMERGAEIPGRKLFAESTPTVTGVCRISRFVESATNRFFHIPCPKCGAFHPLFVADWKNLSKGGLYWDRDKNGEATGNLAATTARFICPTCNQEWGEEHRRPQVRRGIWVAPGEYVVNGKLEGTPVNAGPDESFNLSRMYGATFTFAKYARAYATCFGKEGEQSFLNNWEGTTFTPLKVKMTWMQLAARLCTGKWEYGCVPEQCVFLTCSVDVQDDHFVCTTFGWDNQKIAYLIRHGIAKCWEDVAEWIFRTYRHEDGGPPIQAKMTTIDSKDGNRKDEVIDNCMALNSERGPFVWPSMGMKPGSLQMQYFKNVDIDKDKNVGKKFSGLSIPGLRLTQVNTTMTQEWLDNCIARRASGSFHSIVIHEHVATDEDLFSQLLNEAFNPEKGLWVRLDESTIPVDFRDCFRYARCNAESYVNGNWERVAEKRNFPKATAEDMERRQRQVAVAKERQQEERREPERKIVDRNEPKRRSFVRKPSQRRRFVRGR
ncbi:phage terminase large subunit family protein [Stieleria sp. JC731]|uniref:terminase gpA endonuclease subunit n=1 Tax=Stieleria sp. JC731 TaxID=2894195 RepID=UPI001E63FA7C|nr:terminase gpA endonuclease subunit [Stieleria sp. JC731]MCC9603514.1 phage terminase large subunit family protein [Stieleria sp. JC731]